MGGNTIVPERDGAVIPFHPDLDVLGLGDILYK